MLKELLQLLDNQLGKKTIFLASMFSLTLVLCEAFVVMIIPPYLAYAANTAMLDNYSISKLFPTDKQTQVIAVTTCVIFLSLIATLLRITALQKLNSFIEQARTIISNSVFQSITQMPLAEYQKYEISEYYKIAITEVDQYVAQVVRPFTLMISFSLLAIIILSLLLYINPTLSIGLLLFIGTFYSLVYYILRKKFSSIGGEISKCNKERISALTNVLNDLKYYKSSGRLPSSLETFQKEQHKFSHLQSTNQTIANVPNYLIEQLFLLTLVLLVLYISFTQSLHSGKIVDIIPTITLFVFSALRLKPAFQNIFQGLSAIRLGGAMQSNISTLINAPRLLEYKSKLCFSKSVGKDYLMDISEIILGYEKPLNKPISEKLPKTGLILVDGQSGVGKSTLLDCIMGFTNQVSGCITVNIGCDSVNEWHDKIAYMGQSPSIFQGSIHDNLKYSENTVFDTQLINQLLKRLNIDKLVGKNAELNTKVNESNISGGQKQRLVLARTLASRRPVIILDEPTSALDKENEDNAVTLIRDMSKQSLIIVVSHSASFRAHSDITITLERCL